jgi:hypothetical protein
VFVGPPLLAVVFYALPSGGRKAALYAFVLFSAAALMSWCNIINCLIFSTILPSEK